MTDAQRLQSRLAEQMPLAWRDAFQQVPRHRFIPEAIWVRGDDGRPAPLHCGDAPELWLEAFEVVFGRYAVLD